MNKKAYSFRKRIYSIMYILITIQIGLTALLSLFSTMSVRRSTFENLRQTLNLYNSQISEDLRSVDYFLMEISNYSPDVSSVSIQSDISDSYTNIVRINDLFEFNLRSFPKMEGLYAYFPKNGTWVCYGRNSAATQAFQLNLKEEFTQQNASESLENAGGRKWLAYTFGDDTYFTKTFVNGQSVAGAWTNLETLSETLTDLKKMDALILFLDQEGNVLPSGDFSRLSDTRIPVSKKTDSYQITNYNGSRYLTLTSPLDFCDYSIAALVPLAMIDRSLRPVLQVLAAILLATVLIFVAVSHMLGRFLKGTIGMMESVTEAIAEGESETRIDSDSQDCLEIRQVAQSYNNMIDRIQSLKIDVYEKTIESKTFQLHYFRSQVAPHFLINCLNMISYLADGKAENTALIRRMITTLSGHLRYTLSTNERVPLKKELEYLENYVELSKLRFPGCITYTAQIDPEARDAMVFPLILIMFTENTFKYNLVMGEPLEVIVRATLTDDGRLHLVHIDSGPGYSQEFIDKFNSSAGDFSLKDGTRVGIHNVDRRLRLYYGDSAALTISNEPGLGARTDIDIPYVPYKDSESRGSAEA